MAHGVYLATSGPAYETPAEIRAFRNLGADAVGMSTAPEAQLAHAAGLRVLGLSCITNFAAGISPAPLSHQEVTAATKGAMPRMKAVLSELWKELDRAKT
jgi:purine-nucleoside phosphorylase